VRTSLKYVTWKDYQGIAADLKALYQAPTEQAALVELERFAEIWDVKYPMISKAWRHHWDTLNTLFAYPPEIRKVIYTTNAIESLNSVIRTATRKHKIFAHDDSALKVVYLAVQAASKKWTLPIQNWRMAMNRFMIDFEDRLKNYV
jgi:putative transposase